MKGSLIPAKLAGLLDQSNLFINALHSTVRSTHLPCLLFGGILRDMLGGFTSEDCDIVVKGDLVVFAETLTASLSCHGLQALRTSHSPGGSVRSVFFSTPLIQGAHKIDLVSIESPLFSFSDLQDLKKCLNLSDFTTDALGLLIEESGITFFDPWQGVQDIQANRLRVIRPSIFTDSPKTILKALRLSYRFGFCIDPATESLIQEALDQKVLSKEDPRGLYESFCKLCREECYLDIWQDMRARGIISELFPAACIKGEMPHPLSLIEYGALLEGEMRLMSFFQNSPTTIKVLRDRFALSEEDVDELLATVRMTREA